MRTAIHAADYPLCQVGQPYGSRNESSMKDVRPEGEGVSQKGTHEDPGEGAGGGNGKEQTFSNSNFYQNFRSLNSVLCAIRPHLFP